MNKEKLSIDNGDFVEESNNSEKSVNQAGGGINSINNQPETTSNKLGRRAFFGRTAIGGLVAGGLLAMPEIFGKVSAQSSEEACPSGCELVPYTSGTVRANAAQKRRINAAAYERNMIIPTHPCNGDEQLYANRNYFASYTKGLQRAAGAAGTNYGEVDPAVYCTLLRAVKSGVPTDFEQVLLGFSNSCSDINLSDEAGRLGLAAALPPNLQRRLESPQAGYNFDLEGKDYYQLINRPSSSGTANPPAFPPAFAFASPEEAVEIIENYWQALTRDVPFIEYSTNGLISAAATDLTQFANNYYKGPVEPFLIGFGVTPEVYSRGILPGDTEGPFLSQFLVRDNIPYGAQTISSRIKSPKNSSANDFMTTQPEWLEIQKGRTPAANRMIVPDGIRYIRSGRDLTAYVQNDAIYQAYLNSALLLMTPVEPVGSRTSGGGLGVPLNPNNPYRKNSTLANRYCKQLNFVEFGPSQLLSLLGEVSVRAHKAVWYQKWQVHRRLRPEEFGGRVHFNLFDSSSRQRYPISPVLTQSTVFSRIFSNYGSYFLPQAFPEGSPIHPAYGAGHATLAGACVTILKAWFDSELPYNDFADLFVPNVDGTGLVATPGNTGITVADELNKLASNISIARNIAGVHWRSDYTESVFLGEQVAIQLLADYGFTYNEDFLGFRFRNFSGNLITIGETRQV